jgi:uncharacterized protein (TIGR02145 family)
MKITTLLFIALLSISSFGFSQSVTIGTQTWTTLNLDLATFRNGDAIPEAKTDEEWEAAGDNKQPAWCYYDNDPMNGTKYGKLYNWYAVVDSRGLAPLGYHIPSDTEWTKLSDYLGGEESAGEKMKRNSGWLENGNGTNSSGFSGLPGGFSTISGGFRYVGDFGVWWSASEHDDSNAWALGLVSAYSNLHRDHSIKSFGHSVRCVKD